MRHNPDPGIMDINVIGIMACTPRHSSNLSQAIRHQLRALMCGLAETSEVGEEPGEEFFRPVDGTRSQVDQKLGQVSRC